MADIEPAESKAPRWLVIITMMACAYYAASALTLPFANKLWLGEVAPFVLFQPPKAFIKFVIQQGLLYGVHALGLSAGSHSPDYIATHGWAMLGMVVLPALLLVGLIAIFSRGRQRMKLVGAVLLFATIDGIVTIWFDRASDLSIYNAVYF